MIYRNSEHLFLSLVVLSVTVSMMWAQDTVSENGQQGTVHMPAAVSTEQVNKIAHKLMAPCCWAETADVHRSPAAENVKAQILQALQQGYGEEQIIDKFVATYGERILAEPVAEGFNLLLWILPAVVFVIGSFVLWHFLRRPRAEVVTDHGRPIPGDNDYAKRVEHELALFDS